MNCSFYIIVFNLLSLFEFLKKEKLFGRRNFSLKKLQLLSKGFYSLGQVPFDFKNYKYSDFISDLENIKLSYLNYPYGRLLRDKLVFSLFFKNYCNVPEIYALISKGKVNPVDKNFIQISLDLIIELLENNTLIMKPRFGTSGQGIIKIEKINHNFYKLNETITDINYLKDFIGSLDDYIVVRFIKQGNFAERFFAESTNTIRITTFSDPNSFKGKILYALMRFGTKKSIPVDNVGSGGIYATIDIETGKLDTAIKLFENGKFVYHIEHPETKVQIKDIHIPEWQEIKNDFIQLSTLISPYIKFAGWDIILTDDKYYLIEGNNGPDLYIQGPDKPLALDDSFINFLKTNDVRN